MAGHSKFKNIMHRKGAQDAKRARMFVKISRELTVAAKMGAPDPATNPRLRTAIQAARVANMPKDRVDRAIKAAAGAGDGTDYAEIRYEGYGPGGTAIIVEALTDNRNRTASDVRTIFSKNGGNLGETNSVAFMFDHVGQIIYPTATATSDAMFETAVECGADNVDSGTDEHEVITSVENFAAVRDSLEKKFGEAQAAKLIWQPNLTATPNEDQATQLLKLIDALDDHDDVQTVYANFELDDETLERLAAA